MPSIIVFHPDTGEIIGRISVSDPAQLANYPNHIELDAEDFQSKPELWAEVHPQRRELHPKHGHADPTTKRRQRP